MATRASRRGRRRSSSSAAAMPGSWSRPISPHEDRCYSYLSRIRANPGVFARVRSFGFNILKANRTGTLSQDRYRAALGGLNNLLELLAMP